MKQLFITPLIALALTTGALATTDSDIEVCGQMGDLAKSVMSARQAGTPMSDAMRLTEGHDLVVLIVKKAYAHPQFSVDSNRTDAVMRFRNEIEEMCFSAR